MPDPTMTAAEYLASPALGSTALRIAATESVAHYLARRYEDTPFLRMGRLAHCAALEPDRFVERYRTAERVPCAGGKAGPCSRLSEPGAEHCWQHGGKAEAAAYLATLPRGTELISAEEREQALAAAEGIRFHLKRLNWLDMIDTAGRFEVPLFGRAHLKDEPPGYFLTPETKGTPGLAVRSKIDLLLLPRFAFDLKGTHDLPSAGGWAWRAKREGLHVQAALYSDLVEMHFGEVPEWCWLVHESAKPFGLLPYLADPGLLDSGRELLAEGLRRWAAYYDTGDAWAGWPTDAQVVWEPRSRGEE